jgi:Flp pilus assembly protein TadG
MTKRRLRLLRLRKFGRDDRGSILVQTSFYIIAAMGLVGLAINGGRFLQLHNNLQDLADAAALAGAAQLDGAQDSQTRATNAAQAIARNDPAPAFAYDNDCSGSPSPCTTITTTFLNQLNPDTVANGPNDSYYIKVTTASSTTNATFLAAVAGTNNAAHGTAIAQGFGNNLGSCSPIQSFMCNPYEGTETNRGNANNFSANLSIGTMVHLVNGANAPGNWGLLQPPGVNNNPHDQVPFWAENSAGQCITGPTLAETRTGNVAKDAQSGMNVRFDSPVGSGDESVSAPIVIAGFQPGGGSGSNHLNGNNCQHYGNGYNGGGASEISGPNSVTPVYPPGFDPTNYSCPSGTGFSCPLPRDTTFTNVSTGNAAWSPILIGSGISDLTFQANLLAYWKNHHGGTSLPAGVNSRWTAYQCEAGAGAFVGVAGCPPSWQTDSVEPHAPGTSPNPGPGSCTNSTTGDYTRRVISVAIVDCTYWGITGHSTPIPAATLIAQFFMTEPALDDGSIFAEYMGCVSSNPNDPRGCVGGSNQTVPIGPRSLVQLVR